MRFPVLVAGLLMLGAASAHAQDLSALRTACEADVRKFCANVQPGGGRMLSCLQTNVASLSESCSVALKGLKAAAPK